MYSYRQVFVISEVSASIYLYIVDDQGDDGSSGYCVRQFRNLEGDVFDSVLPMLSPVIVGTISRTDDDAGELPRNWIANE